MTLRRSGLGILTGVVPVAIVTVLQTALAYRATSAWNYLVLIAIAASVVVAGLVSKAERIGPWVALAVVTLVLDFTTVGVVFLVLADLDIARVILP